MAERSLVSRIIDWLRAGYPNGVPERDYVPLLAILRRQLTEDEVQQVSSELIAESAPPPEPISKIDAGVKITEVTQELPHETDISRVRTYLEDQGWPFDNSPLASPTTPGDTTADEETTGEETTDGGERPDGDGDES